MLNSGNISDPTVSTLRKRLIYRNRELCLHAFSFLVAGNSSSYRKKAIRSTVKQVEKEYQPSNFSEFVDPSELSSRAERRSMLVDLAAIGKNDFATASAFAFCVDHMSLLCCHDPENGQKQVDTAVMENLFDLYQTMCGGADSVGTVSKATFDRLLTKAVATGSFKIKARKTVSKCEVCEFFPV